MICYSLDVSRCSLLYLSSFARIRLMIQGKTGFDQISASLLDENITCDFLHFLTWLFVSKSCVAV